MLSKAIVIVAALAVVLGAPNIHKRPTKGGRIVGGYNATIQEFPHQASVEWIVINMCGAAIISETFIVTSAHCTSGLPTAELRVRVGTSISEKGGRLVFVKHVHEHPQFNENTHDWDIAVLELLRPLVFDENIQPIALPPPGVEVAVGTAVSVSGFGQYEAGTGGVEPGLQAANLTIISHEDCEKAYDDEVITSRMICAGGPGGGEAACEGDTGGPLVGNGTLWGIVSFGYGCARPGHPGVYGSVTALRDFITDITGL